MGKSPDELLESLYKQAEAAVDRTVRKSDEVEVEPEPAGDEGEEVPVEVEAEAAPAVDLQPKVDELTARVAEVEKALDQAKRDGNDKYLRAMADLENLRKRSRKEVEEARQKAKEDTLREVLTVVDNLERALASASDQITLESLLQGVQMVFRQFTSVLERLGAVPFESVGQPFDPTKHEALSQVETADHPPGAVASEMQKGYMLGTRLIRPALVAVAKAPSVVTEAPAAAEPPAAEPPADGEGSET